MQKLILLDQIKSTKGLDHFWSPKSVHDLTKTGPWSLWSKHGLFNISAFHVFGYA